MAWGTPPTFTVGQILTAANMNILSGNDKVLRQYRQDLTAQGFIAENAPVPIFGTSSAYTSQAVHGQILNLRAGDTINGLILRVWTAAAGTSVTTGRMGLTDSTGSVLILSSNYNTAANFPAGPNAYAFTSPYTITTDGAYYAVWVISGAFGTTSPTFMGTTLQSAAVAAAYSTFVPFAFRWTGQTDLPGIGSAVTMTTADTIAYYTAVYGTTAY